MKDYISKEDATQKWSISKCSIMILGNEGRILHVIKIGRKGVILQEAENPQDAHIKSGRCIKLSHKTGGTR